MARPPDSVRIEAEGGLAFDLFTSVQISNDITQPSEAAFEVGNDGTWAELYDRVSHGTPFKIFLNDRLRLTGRVELLDLPVDGPGGSELRFTVRTKLADAQYASARESISVRNTSIKDFLLALYEPLGYSVTDFVFSPGTARDLLTGKSTGNKGDPISVDLEPMQEQEARVSPPETIYEAADRHLRRHGLMHWDAPDGRIVVGSPNDTQDPIYQLRMNRGAAGRENNILGATRTQDWSGIPSVLALYGGTAKAGTSRKRIGAVVEDADVRAAGFYRPVTINAEALRMQTLADRAAARELSARSKSKDCWEIELDGLSWWDGKKNVNWGVDCVVAIDSDIAGGPLGAYYVHRVVCRRDARGGDTTNLSVLKKGIWRL